jgi:NAD(P)-dependent dehydrogenase (short-subunit alcohol dehydrogenase family)
MRFTGQVALVTGAASGIGEATAKKLAAQGAAAVVADIDTDNGERVATEIQAAGGTASFLRTDVSSEDDVRKLVHHAVSTHGGLHLAVNNAGLAHAPAPLHQIPLETYDRLFAIDIRGVLLCMREELAHFVAHGGGAIVNMASGTGLKASAGLSAYVAAKHAVVGLTRTLANEVGRYFIRVNNIQPTAVNTNMIHHQGVYNLFFPDVEDPTAEQFNSAFQALNVIPVPYIEPRDVSDAVLWLASDESRYVTGVSLPVDAGFLQKIGAS